MGPIILDELIAHYTATLMLCKSSLWINEVFSVDQHFCDFTHLLGRLKVSSPNRKSVGSFSPTCVGLTGPSTLRAVASSLSARPMPLGGRHQVTKDMGQINYGSCRKKCL